MINFEDMIRAQRVMWVKQILAKGDTNYIKYVLKDMMGFEFFKCSLCPALMSMKNPTLR